MQKMVPYVGLRYKRLVLFELPTYRRSRLHDFAPKGNLPEDRLKAYSGDMSQGSVRRFKKAFENMLEIAEWKESTEVRKIEVLPGQFVDKAYQLRFRVNFITLTLPAGQGHVTDRQIHNECFMPWLDALRYRYPGISYVWKAEVQQRGAIHYHICTDHYVDKGWLNSSWKKRVQVFGYMSQFRAKHGHSNAPCAQVVAARNDADIAGYLGKYLSKSDKSGRKLGIKVWDCSRNLKAKEIRNVPMSAAVGEWVADLIRSEKVQYIQTDQCVILQSPVEFDIFDLPDEIAQMYYDFISTLKNPDHVPNYYQPPDDGRDSSDRGIPSDSHQSRLPTRGRPCRIRGDGQQRLDLRHAFTGAPY